LRSPASASACRADEALGPDPSHGRGRSNAPARLRGTPVHGSGSLQRSGLLAPGTRTAGLRDDEAPLSPAGHSPCPALRSGRSGRPRHTRAGSAPPSNAHARRRYHPASTAPPNVCSTKAFTSGAW
jgi:hypothetical protein